MNKYISKGKKKGKLDLSLLVIPSLLLISTVIIHSISTNDNHRHHFVFLDIHRCHHNYHHHLPSPIMRFSIVYWNFFLRILCSLSDIHWLNSLIDKVRCLSYIQSIIGAKHRLVSRNPHEEKPPRGETPEVIQRKKSPSRKGTHVTIVGAMSSAAKTKTSFSTMCSRSWETEWLTSAQTQGWKSFKIDRN